MSQSYDNHVHRPVATGVGFLFVVIALVALVLRWFGIGGRASFAIGLLAILGSISTLLLISRTYITRLQDRIIKLEMRLRMMALLPPDRAHDLTRLTNKQLAALRFASDEELPRLVDRAVKESLKPDDIKRAIKTWVPDLDRT
jgi:Family of unknown function (DUF6526)